MANANSEECEMGADKRVYVFSSKLKPIDNISIKNALKRIDSQ